MLIKHLKFYFDLYIYELLHKSSINSSLIKKILFYDFIKFLNLLKIIKIFN